MRLGAGDSHDSGPRAAGLGPACQDRALPCGRGEDSSGGQVSQEATYPKRLIEVDLPIKRISAHARREKDMRRGHIPLAHIYPAARPPASCRAVICAALWPDPADPLCPQAFRYAAARLVTAFARKVVGKGEKLG